MKTQAITIRTFVLLVVLYKISNGSPASDDLVAFDRPLSRSRRDANLDRKVFVIPRELPISVLQLFTLAPGLGPSAGVTYAFANDTSPLPAGLAIDQTSGIVSRKLKFDQNLTEINFDVVVDSNGTGSILPVTVKIISRSSDDPIFSNLPTPMWAVCPVWIRPGTVVYRLRSVDLNYNATDMVYSLESGGSGYFDVNPSTGEVSIVGRQQFQLDKVFTLVVSARSRGSRFPGSILGQSQSLNIKVGAKEPQFFWTPYNITFFENATRDSIIGKVEAKSFQDLPLTFSMTPSGDASSPFVLDGSTGEIRLTRALTFALDVRQYFFNVTIVERYSNFSTTAPLILTLLSINHPPAFSSTRFTLYNISEDYPIGAELLEMVVRDYDPGAMGTLSFSASVDNFAVEQKPNGLYGLKLIKKLDYESVINGEYNFSVVAYDGGTPSLSATTTVQIWVLNTNDEPPRFEPPEQTIYVREGAGIGTVLFYIQAYDPDGNNITFSYYEATNDRYFSVDSSSGAVKLEKSISAGQSIFSFNLSVTITDDGACCRLGSAPRSTPGVVTVNVLSVNTQPIFPECKSYNPSVMEDYFPNGTLTILNMTATDKDNGVNGELTFEIVGDVVTKFFQVFQNGTKTVELRQIDVIRRDTPNVLQFNDVFKFPVTVMVQDMGFPRLSSYCLLFVTINTVNKYSPEFDYSQYPGYVYIPDLSASTRTLRVFAFDLDYGANGVVKYYMGNEPNCQDLSVEEQSGWIRWNGRTTQEKLYSCSVTAKDGGTPPRSASVQVSLNFSSSIRVPRWMGNIDDNPITVLENAPIGSVVANLSASIEGGLEIGFYIPRDQLPALNGDGNFAESVASTGATSIMSVVLKKNLARPNFRPEYILRCRAFVKTRVSTEVSAASVASVARLRIVVKDVNNEPPVFYGTNSDGVYTAAVTKYSLDGDYVVSVTAIDMDLSWSDNRGKVRYSLKDNTDPFAINATTGNITVRSSGSRSPIFDPDSKPMYVLVVVATDGDPGTDSMSAVATVLVTVSGGTRGDPHFTGNFIGSLSEGLPRLTRVLNASATVNDSQSSGFAKSIVRYNIQGGNGLRNFAVNPDSGEIYTVRPVMYSYASNYILDYAVFNGLRNVMTKVLISINPQNIFPPEFDRANYSYSGPPIVEKDQSIGKTVATVSAKVGQGRRGGGPLTYRSTRPSDFAVNSLGEVTIARSLSRDSPDGFAPQQVGIEASDGVNPPAYTVVVVDLADLNDHRPLFDLCCTRGSVNENAIRDSKAMQLRAWDADFGPNATVTYSLLDDPSGSFNVNSDGAVVTVKPLDFEKRQKYTIKVQARDNGPQPLSSDTSVDIYVVDVNESPPGFPASSYSVSIPEELPASSPVLAVNATDGDPMAQMDFSIVDGGLGDGSFFYVETLQTFNGSFETSTAQRLSTAVIRIAKRIDFDINKKSEYSITLAVRDSPNGQVTTQVKINVYDVNDNPPVFAEAQKVANLSEDVAVDREVGTFAATDADSGINRDFTYSIDYENSDQRFMFKVDQAGVVRIRSKLDFEWKSTMKVNILAIDKGSPPLTGTATLVVNVQNAEDGAPVLRSRLSVDPYSVPTNRGKGFRVVCLNATDPERQNSQGSNLNYEFACAGFNAERCSDFSIGNDGCISTNRDDYSNLNYRSYVIPVKITNKSGSQRSTTEIVGLTIDNTTPGKLKSTTKVIQVMNYAGGNGSFSAIPLGSAYTLSPGSPGDVKYALEPASTLFYLVGDQLWLRGNVSAGEQTTSVKLTDPTGQQAYLTAKVNVKFVNESALGAASSLRIIGLRDARDLLQPSGDRGVVLDSLANQIAKIVGQNAVVEILSAWTASQDVSGSSVPVVDVLYAAHGSPYYSPEKLSSLVWNRRNEIFSNIGLNVSMSPVDLCRSEFYGCWRSGCETKLVVDDGKPRLVNTDENSFVGLSARFQQSCSCAPGRTSFSASGDSRCAPDSCLNGGICSANNSVISCFCPDGFEGPRCQKMKVSIRDGFVLLPPLASCEVSHLSLEFLADDDCPANSLLLYNGPTAEPTVGPGTYEEVSSLTYRPKDFLLLELSNGKPQLRVDFGDGEVKLNFDGASLSSLIDKKWHSIDIIHVGREVRLMVDKCGRADLSENISSSTLNASQCEVRATAPEQRFLVNSVTPLQLGGRHDSSNPYPRDWSKAGFRGCLRNLNHNGEVYDLSLGSWREYSGATGTCQGDGCGSCPPNATCLPDVVLGSSVCSCPPGFRGSSCDIPTTVKYFDQNGFAYWKPSDEFKSAINASRNAPIWFTDRVELSFRTRQANGVLFVARSFTDLERYLLEVKGGTISLACDLGSGDINLTLPDVNISDGQWHRILVVRHGNMVEMHLDSGGSGRRYNASLPTNEHRLLKIDAGVALGDVAPNPWTNGYDTRRGIEKSCITDVRYGGYWWPLDVRENSVAKVTASVTLEKSADSGCTVGACRLSCPSKLICRDFWQDQRCVCEDYLSPLVVPANDQCLATTCRDSPCRNGATCVLLDNQVTCICPPGWFGPMCSSSTPVGGLSNSSINLAAAIALPIIFAILLLLLLAFLIWWCCCSKKRDALLYDEPDKYDRENVYAYDDEGAGEEDNYGFDLSQFQKKSSPFETDYTSAPALAGRAGTGRAMPGVWDYISDKLNDIDNDQNVPSDDARVDFNFEGRGSISGSLSSLASNDSDRDADFGWLEDAGAPFEGLANLYDSAGQV